MGKIMADYNRDFYTETARISCEKRMLGVDKAKIALQALLQNKQT